jgi:tetratricopeptide (TPR) repeat protein
MDTRMLLRDRLRRSRDWVTAIDELEKELEQSGAKPEQSERLYELARLTEEVVPEREKALGLYQRAWKLHPDNLKALSRAREVYGELGRHEMVAKLGEMELKSPAAHVDLAAIVGEALLDSGQKQKAQAFLERALEKTPSAVRVKDALAALNYEPEFWQDEVDRLAESAGQEEPKTAARMLLRAARIMRIEAPEDPRYQQLLERIFEYDLDDPSANAMYESLLAAGQRWDEIAAHHERRVQAAGGLAEQIERARGFALVWVQRFKDRDRAATFFGKALLGATSNGSGATMRSIPAAFTLLKQVLGARGEWKLLVDRAEAILSHLVSDEDKLFVANLAGVVSWRELSDIDRARGFFRLAHEIEPTAPDVADFVASEGLEDEATVVHSPSLAEIAAVDVSPPRAPLGTAPHPVVTPAASVPELQAIRDDGVPTPSTVTEAVSAPVIEIGDDDEDDGDDRQPVATTGRATSEPEISIRPATQSEPTAPVIEAIEAEPSAPIAAQVAAPEAKPAAVEAKPEAAAVEAKPEAAAVEAKPEIRPAAPAAVEAKPAAATVEAKPEIRPAAAPAVDDPELGAAMAAARGADSVAAWKDVIGKHPGSVAPRRELARVLRAAGTWQPLVDALKDEDAKAAQSPAE